MQGWVEEWGWTPRSEKLVDLRAVKVKVMEAWEGPEELGCVDLPFLFNRGLFLPGGPGDGERRPQERGQG